jgi:putative hydrolase of the HAD superfamily
MDDLGYGVKAFIISLLETALQVSGGEVSGSQVGEIIKAGRLLLHNPAVPLPGVRDTLEKLSAAGKYRLVLFTKGDLLDQGHKIDRSGLRSLFDDTVIVSNKQESDYQDLCKRLGIRPDELLSIGNSFRSDIAPLVKIGGWGIHVPYEVTWEHEKMEEFESPRILRVSSFREIPLYL